MSNPFSQVVTQHYINYCNKVQEQLDAKYMWPTEEDTTEEEKEDDDNGDS